MHPTPSFSRSRGAGATLQHTPGLDRFARAAVGVMAFTLPACTGRPFTLSSGFFCLLCAAALLLRNAYSPRRIEEDLAVSNLTLGLWVTWAILATVSAGVSLDLVAFMNAVCGYWVPLAIFTSVASLRMHRADFEWIIATFAAGLAVRFGYAAFVFYTEWGMLGLGDLFLARDDLPRMFSYLAVTYGNLSDSASLLAVSMPVLVLALVVMPLSTAARALVISCIAIVGVNILITGSRSALLVPTLALAIAAVKFRSVGAGAFLVALGIIVHVFGQATGEVAADRISAAATGDITADNSLAERWDSIEIGIRIMFENPLGVGPGMSFKYNPYSVAHQFTVSQGSELGPIGAVIVIALTVVIIIKVMTVNVRSQAAAHKLPFLFGALTWILFATTTNMTMNNGPNIPWIGVLALFLGLAYARDDRH